MSHSLNEIEAMSKRAARGAGLSWGLAEEAAKGTRWLCSFGLPGTEMLADLLNLNDGLPAIDLSPTSLTGIWHAPSGRLSPLIAGAALSDCAVQLQGAGRVEMINVSLPLLLVPFVGGAALRLGVPVAVEWDDVCLTSDGRQLRVQGTSKSLEVRQASKVVVSTPADLTGQMEPGLRGNVSKDSWAQLGSFAHRTYAPATEDSRLRGAGAGLNDND